jgi:cellulose synthase operon protein C
VLSSRLRSTVAFGAAALRPAAFGVGLLGSAVAVAAPPVTAQAGVGQAGAPREVRAGSERLVWPGAVGGLEARLLSEDVEVRRRAAADLGRLPAPVQRRLLPRLFSDPDPDVRLAVADAALAIRLPGAGARVSPWLSDPDPRAREAAAEVLAVLRDAGSIPGLGRALEDAEASVRAAAAAALGNSRSPDATSFLLGHLDDADPEVRQAVITALADLGDPRAVVPLIGRIQEQRAALRRQAAQALGALGDPRAVGALVVALADADAGVRVAAALALGKLKASDAVWSLGTLLESEADPEVQSAALDALGSIATPTAVDTILRAQALPRPPRDRIENALANAGPVALSSLERCVLQPGRAGGAEVCVAALGSIGGESATLLIERALRQGSVSAAAAIEALGTTGQASALPTVLEFLTSGVQAERRAAIEAAGELLDPEREIGLAVEPIAQALSHAQESRLERAALVGLLGRTGSARAAPSLLAAAASSDEYLRVVALQALGELGPADADSALLAGLEAVAFPTRYSAAVALRRVGRHRSIDPLLERLRSAIASDREILGLALAGPIGDAPTDVQIQRLIDALESSPGPVADALIEALAHVPGPRGTRALEGLVPRVGKLGRAKLAEALAAHAEAAPVLLGLLADPDAGVRANAAWALGAVGSGAALAALGALRADADLAVASNSIAALASIAAREGADVGATLCAALDDERALVLANAMSGLRRLGVACPKPEAATWWLEHHASEEVRLAAARLIRDRWTALAPAALSRCAAKDVSGRVAIECAAAPSAEFAVMETVSDVGVLVVDTGETMPAPRAPFALVRADGFIRSGMSDRRGAVWEASVPRGPVRLTLPGVFVD